MGATALAALPSAIAGAGSLISSFTGGGAPQTIPVETASPAVQQLRDSIAGRLQGQGFDLQQFQGPFAAGPNQFQTDAMQALQGFFSGGGLQQGVDQQGSSALMMSGDPATNPQTGASINAQQQPFNFGVGDVNNVLGGLLQGTGQQMNPSDLGSSQNLIGQVLQGGGQQTEQLTNQLLGGFSDAVQPDRFDQTQMFQEARGLFEENLDERMANIRERFSGLGLGPGSTDLTETLVEEAGGALSRFNLGQQQIAQESFQNAQQRQLQALGLGGEVAAVSEIPGQRALSALPFQLDVDTTPFQQALADRGQRFAAAPGLAGAALEGIQLPFQQALSMFGVGEQLRQGQDLGIARQLAEFARTQGGGLEQMLQFMQVAPGRQVGVGPSQASQLGALAGSLGQAAGAILPFLDGAGGGADLAQGLFGIGGSGQSPFALFG